MHLPSAWHYNINPKPYSPLSIVTSPFRPARSRSPDIITYKGMCDSETSEVQKSPAQKSAYSVGSPTHSDNDNNDRIHHKTTSPASYSTTPTAIQYIPPEQKKKASEPYESLSSLAAGRCNLIGENVHPRQHNKMKNVQCFQINLL